VDVIPVRPERVVVVLKEGGGLLVERILIDKNEYVYFCPRCGRTLDEDHGCMGDTGVCRDCKADFGQLPGLVDGKRVADFGKTLAGVLSQIFA
jgi:hypothetical protein